jgi:hypothetical protein
MWENAQVCIPLHGFLENKVSYKGLWECEMHDPNEMQVWVQFSSAWEMEN